MGNGDLNHSGLVKFVEEFAKTEFTQLNSPAASESCASLTRCVHKNSRQA